MARRKPSKRVHVYQKSLTYNKTIVIISSNTIGVWGDPTDAAMAIANTYFEQPPIRTTSWGCLEISYVDNKYSLWLRKGTEVPSKWPEVVAAFDRIVALRAFR